MKSVPKPKRDPSIHRVTAHRRDVAQQHPLAKRARAGNENAVADGVPSAEQGPGRQAQYDCAEDHHGPSANQPEGGHAQKATDLAEHEIRGSFPELGAVAFSFSHGGQADALASPESSHFRVSRYTSFSLNREKSLYPRGSGPAGTCLRPGHGA